MLPEVELDCYENVVHINHLIYCCYYNELSWIKRSNRGMLEGCY